MSTQAPDTAGAATAATPDEPVFALPLLRPAERERILTLFRRGRVTLADVEGPGQPIVRALPGLGEARDDREVLRRLVGERDRLGRRRAAPRWPPISSSWPNAR